MVHVFFQESNLPADLLRAQFGLGHFQKYNISKGGTAMTANEKTHEDLGTILERDYFQPRNLSIYKVSKDTGIPKETIYCVLFKKQRLDVKEALLLARYFEEEHDDIFAKMQLQDELIQARQYL